MYPFVNQLMKKNLGMLVLDVKGNFHNKIKEFAKLYNKKVTVIELNGKETYNPLDKPNLKPSVLANRLRTILTLFSNQNTSDTYWLDKVESFLTEAIKLCRIYNEGYVTFIELHKLIYDKYYLNQKISLAKNLFLSNSLSKEQIYEFSTCLDFFFSEFKMLDSRVLSIIQSEISRITQIFVNDLDVKNTFCPPKEKITFKVEKGSILGVQTFVEEINKEIGTDMIKWDGSNIYLNMYGQEIEVGGWYYKGTDEKFDFMKPIYEDATIEMKLFGSLGNDDLMDLVKGLTNYNN